MLSPQQRHVMCSVLEVAGSGTMWERWLNLTLGVKELGNEITQEAEERDKMIAHNIRGGIEKSEKGAFRDIGNPGEGGSQKPDQKRLSSATKQIRNEVMSSG